MTDTITVPSRARVPARRPAPLTGLFRRAVHRGLAGVRCGEVVLRERGAAARFGDPAASLRAVVEVADPRFHRAVALGGSLGAAESYGRGDWRADDLVALLRIFVRDLQTTDRLEGGMARLRAPLERVAHALRANSRRGSRRNIHAHYDLGNDLFALFLDETMTYSCGIFEHPQATMHEASIAKLDRICRKLDLRPTDHLLEIGTGWGSLALHAAARYGCRVTTTTISREQHELARARIEAAGLADRVTLLLEDYRDLTGAYDKLVSVEMVEAVGHRYLGQYFGACSRLLAPDGLLLIQAITMPDHRYRQYLRTTDFIRRDVFPGSNVPSLEAMNAAIARSSDLRLVHLEDLTPHYATTLRHWRERFLDREARVRALGYDETFIRLFEYYLAYCEAGFAERYTGDVQLVLAKPGNRRPPILPPLGGDGAG